MSGVRFPATPAEITPRLLTMALAEAHPEARVADVDLVSVKRCGEGVASTADRIVLDLTYARDVVGLPSRMVLKTVLATPHAPGEMFDTEVSFYRSIRPELDIETPRCFAASYDPESRRFGLLFEDLTERGARFPDAVTDVSVDEVAATLSQLATLHAQFWGSARFAGDLAWVATPFSGGMSHVFSEHGLALVADQVRRHPIKAELIAPLGHDLDSLWRSMEAATSQMALAPQTLLHGDTHVANTYLLPDGTAGLLDWQLQVRGCFAHDVAYLVSTALDPLTRRACLRDLVAHYLDGLRGGGVVDAPTVDEAIEWCRRGVLWGLVIGWLITPPGNYGPDIMEANIERMVRAVADFGALDAISEGPPVSSGG